MSIGPGNDGEINLVGTIVIGKQFRELPLPTQMRHLDDMGLGSCRIDLGRGCACQEEMSAVMLERKVSGYCHAVTEVTRWNLVGIQPVAHPAKGNVPVGGIAESNHGIIVDSLINPKWIREIIGLKFLAIEVSDEILGNAASVGATGVDVNNQDPLFLAAVLKAKQIRALPDCCMRADSFAEIAQPRQFLRSDDS